jgi:hypothetical protein
VAIYYYHRLLAAGTILDGRYEILASLSAAADDRPQTAREFGAAIAGR